MYPLLERSNILLFPVFWNLIHSHSTLVRSICGGSNNSPGKVTIVVILLSVSSIRSRSVQVPRLFLFAPARSKQETEISLLSLFRVSQLSAIFKETVFLELFANLSLFFCFFCSLHQLSKSFWRETNKKGFRLLQRGPSDGRRLSGLSVLRGFFKLVGFLSAPKIALGRLPVSHSSGLFSREKKSARFSSRSFSFRSPIYPSRERYLGAKVSSSFSASLH